jgi:nucleolar GTP-binding protein
MSFQGIPKIEEPDFYLGVAFRKATHKAELEREKVRKDKLTKSKLIELAKIDAIRNSLKQQLNNIVDKFPMINKLDEFYYELFKALIDLAGIRKSLAAVKWASESIDRVSKDYTDRIKRCQDIERINSYRRQYYGRVSSFVKQIRKNLEFIEQARLTVREFPTIKTKYESIAIVGFPNVGKTTLMSKLTGSKPEINFYPFTTKGINVGYIEKEYDKIQILDTPGTLNRIDKMNSIEKQAYLVMKLLAKRIVYVFDLTEPYPMDMQEELLEKVKELKKPILLYLSKTDVLPADDVEKFRKKYHVLSIEELKKELLK